jgi:hypothetical protein
MFPLVSIGASCGPITMTDRRIAVVDADERGVRLSLPRALGQLASTFNRVLGYVIAALASIKAASRLLDNDDRSCFFLPGDHGARRSAEEG